MTRRLVIIGADAAGMSAAAEARRHDPDLEIVAFDRGGYASYSQCGLPYLLGGLVRNREALIARTVAQFAQQNIAVHLGHDVVAIEPERGTVLVRGDGRETKERYDALLIATGASPVRGEVPGLHLDGVFHLDVMEDALAIEEYITTHTVRRAVVVGGGYIGLEMVENLRQRGLAVSLIHRHEHLFPTVDTEIAVSLAGELERNGVDLTLCDTVVEACQGSHGRLARVDTNAGSREAELLILATGVKPNVALAAAAGIVLGATGAIAVDQQLRTNLPGIWAAGDCAEHWHRLLLRPSWIPLGSTANKQGRVAGRVIAGGDDTFTGIVGTAITRVFDLEVARTGLGERIAHESGFDPAVTILQSTDHAGYLRDARPLTLKLLAERSTGRVLGCQALGHGADKRIDVVATALYAGLTLHDLVRLDLEYAPPFNSVWDPVQVAATSLLRKEIGRNAV